MKPGDLWDSHNSAAVGRFSFAFNGCVPFQRQMSTRVEIVVEVQSKNAKQVTLVEYNDLVQAFSANGSYQALATRILPGRLCRTNDFLDAHVSDALLEHIGIDSVAITDEKSRRCIVRKCFDNFLCRPLGCRMRCDVELYDASAIVAHDDEGKEYAEGSR